MIGGFILGPEGVPAASILLRAIGPSLTAFGITNPLVNPTLELHDPNGNLLQSNDNWKENTNKDAILATGIAPSDDSESAILTSLSAGNYTAIVSSKDGTTGVALVEIYRLAP